MASRLFSFADKNVGADIKIRRHLSSTFRRNIGLQTFDDGRPISASVTEVSHAHPPKIDRSPTKMFVADKREQGGGNLPFSVL